MGVSRQLLFSERAIIHRLCSAAGRPWQQRRWRGADANVPPTGAQAAAATAMASDGGSGAAASLANSAAASTTPGGGGYATYPLERAVDAVAERTQFGAEALSLVGGNVGEERRLREQTRLAEDVRRMVREGLPRHCRLDVRDIAWVSPDLCFVGVGIETNFAGFRYAMSRNLFQARRVAAVRDIFDRSAERRATLDRVFKVVSDDVTAMLAEVQEPPRARLVNEYVAPFTFVHSTRSNQHREAPMSEGQEGAADHLTANDPTGPAARTALPQSDSDGMTEAATSLSEDSHAMAVPHMGGYTLSLHDVDFVEYLHDIGLRIVPINTEQEMRALTAATIPVQQSTNHLLMVAPTAFEPNLYAAQDNAFMRRPEQVLGDTAAAITAAADDSQHTIETIRRRVLDEYAQLFLQMTRHVGARVHLFTHDKYHDAPDSVFPNNWFSTHTDLEVGECTLVLYPMKSPNRRKERRPEFISRLHSFRRYTHVYDMTREENSKTPRYLEGTGSLVLDRVNRTAYVAISERSDPNLARTWARVVGYDLITFRATDVRNRPIYHTNVMMCIGTRVAIVCAESIEDARERDRVLDRLRSTGHEVVNISREQMCRFCGNALEVESRYGRPVMAMSTGAFHAFTPEQHSVLSAHLDDIAHADIRTIEAVGGGGVRCSVAELM
ncbi:hypothetical protein CDCA_CDCA14G3807 [Cyanidium caldarium]|uniref:Amidinotransferase n=1 Tax=Cyanidium caldarium TaxID=2771 RepID=A0AAV9IZL7_CYACA|nr:hypothetical protein CDCA_CDCA14G3807 [Cyanidium caldarium]